MTNEGETGGVIDLYRNQHGVFLEGQFLVDVLSDLDVSHELRYPYHCRIATFCFITETCLNVGIAGCKEEMTHYAVA